MSAKKAAVKKGQTVLYTFPKGSMDPNRGQTDTVPAIVVAAWSETCVNLRVFQDGSGNPKWMTSVPLKDASNEQAGNYWEPVE